MGLLADECLDRGDEATARGWRWLAAEGKWPADPWGGGFKKEKPRHHARLGRVESMGIVTVPATSGTRLPGWHSGTVGKKGPAAWDLPLGVIAAGLGWVHYKSLQDALGAAAASAGLWLEKQTKVAPAQSSCDSEGV